MGSLEVGSFSLSTTLRARFSPQPACATRMLSNGSAVHMESWRKSSQFKSLFAVFYPRLIYPYYQTHKQMTKRYSSISEAIMTSETKKITSNLLVGNEKLGVLLLNLGGPETLEDVQPFLFNLFADPDIIRLPRLFRFLQKPLAQFVSIVRAPKSKEGYASIGGGSPLRQITDAQYRGGAELLVEAGDQRRIIQLPPGMQGKVAGAKFIKRSLVVTLR